MATFEQGGNSDLDKVNPRLNLNPESIIVGLSPIIAENPNRIESVGRDNPLNFSSYAIDHFLYDDQKGEKLAHLKSLVGGKPVIDFGAGKDTDSYKLACLLGASGYVGVEPFNADKLVSNISEIAKDKIKLRFRRDYGGKIKFEEVEVKPINFSVVSKDALSFARTVPNGSGNVFSFGVDETIVKNANYIQNTCEEISRILPDNGVFIGENTVFTPASQGGKIQFDRPNSTRNYGVKVYKVKTEEGQGN